MSCGRGGPRRERQREEGGRDEAEGRSRGAARDGRDPPEDAIAARHGSDPPSARRAGPPAGSRGRASRRRTGRREGPGADRSPRARARDHLGHAHGEAAGLVAGNLLQHAARDQALAHEEPSPDPRSGGSSASTIPSCMARSSETAGRARPTRAPSPSIGTWAKGDSSMGGLHRRDVIPSLVRRPAPGAALALGDPLRQRRERALGPPGPCRSRARRRGSRSRPGPRRGRGRRAARPGSPRPRGIRAATRSTASGATETATGQAARPSISGAHGLGERGAEALAPQRRQDARRRSPRGGRAPRGSRPTRASW